jgi:hypothetical protein
MPSPLHPPRHLAAGLVLLLGLFAPLAPADQALRVVTWKHPMVLTDLVDRLDPADRLQADLGLEGRRGERRLRIWLIKPRMTS